MKTLRRSAHFFCSFGLGLTMLAAFPAAMLGAAESKSVEQWDVFEVTLKGPADGNPFIDVALSAHFAQGARTFDVAGFYDGEGVYKIRFMPDATGEWRFETAGNRPELAGQRGAFTVTPPGKSNHGPVRVARTFHFDYADGTPYRQLGTTCYAWTHRPDALEEQTLKSLAASPFNKVRMCVFPTGGGARSMRYAPFEGAMPTGWDKTRFNPIFFRHLEQRVGQLRDIGVEADLIVFHPYDTYWGFNLMDAASDDRYVRYLIARLAAYRNVWWSLSNEYDFNAAKTEADWDRFGALVQLSDPYGHLRSIHNGSLIYDHNKPWITHASIQNGLAVEEPGRAELYRDVYRKPIVYDEVKYEGRSPYRWGNLSGEEMVHRFWCGTVAGTYVGHGDYFFTTVEDTWTSFGGKLSGQSAPRLAFLRKILEDSPAEGIEPIDRWQDPRVGGKSGEYYLMYFGRETPTAWAFRLYKNGVADGMRFKIEVIDTWAMTITPVEGEFVAKKLNNYDFLDATGRAVTLPGKPGMALRIRRVGAAGPAGKPSTPVD